MATLEKIRNMSPILLGVFAVVLVLFFVLGDLDPSAMMQQGAEHQNKVIAVIGDEEVKTVEYDRLNTIISNNLKRQQESSGNANVEIDEITTRTQAWNGLIETKILEKLSKDAGILFTDKVIADMVVNNPPPAIQNSFKDSLGNFDKEIYLKVATDPVGAIESFSANAEISEEEKLKAVQQYRDFFNSYIQQFKQQRLSINSQTLLSEAGSNLSLAFVKDKYRDEYSTASMNYIKFDVNLIKNSDITISEQDIKEYYEKNKKKYSIEEKRKIKYVSFPLIPSSKDSLKAKEKITDISNSMYKAFTPEDQKKIFDEKLVKYNGKILSYQPVSDLPADVSKYLANLKIGSFVGPIKTNNSTKFYRLDDRRQGDSTKTVVRASHILFKDDPFNQDSVKKLADKIYKEIKSGASFEEMAAKYSADGSKNAGGDLGYFGRGKMVPEFEDASFNAEVGELVKPVKTQFGYHIIKVLDKSSDEIKYSEISIKPKMSFSTKSMQFSNARNLYNKVSNGENIDELAEKLGAKVVETGLFDNTRSILGSNRITRFTFDNEVGTLLEPQEFDAYGAVVIQISGLEKAGFESLEVKTPIIKEKLMKEKKLDAIEERAKKVYNTLKTTNDLSKAIDIDPNLNVLFAPSISNNGILPSSNLREPNVTQVAFKTDLNKLSEPIRGDYGYYIILVSNRTVPEDAAIDKEIGQYYLSELNKSKRSVYFKWFEAIRKNTQIEDYRYDTYNKY